MEERKEIFSWVKAILIAVLLAFAIRTFIFAPIIVDGESMMPTLHNHERVVLNKMGTDIEDMNRFDVIVFHATEKKDYIKRVIGLPGDRIKYEDDVLYVNDKPVDEPYLNEYKQMTDGLLTWDFTLDETVPEGQLFVMGDNRQNSLDSREIGTISIDQVVGKASFVYWPVKEIKLIK